MRWGAGEGPESGRKERKGGDGRGRKRGPANWSLLGRPAGQICRNFIHSGRNPTSESKLQNGTVFLFVERGLLLSPSAGRPVVPLTSSSLSPPPPPSYPCVEDRPDVTGPYS